MNKRRPFMDELISELLAGERAAGDFEQPELTSVQEDFRRLAGLDYPRHLRAGFDRRAVHELIHLASKEVWPHLNREQIRPRPTRFLAQLLSGLGVDLQAYPQGGPGGLGLRGFYLNVRHRRLKRPLIYVNTAHVQGAIGTTFCHEVGHHLGAEIFGRCRPANFFFYSGYEDHLRDPVELAADALVSLAGYPQVIARRLFGDPQTESSAASHQELSGAVLKKVAAHVRGHYGLNLGRIGSTEQKLQYLAGALHYAKLRRALLAEYRI